MKITKDELRELYVNLSIKDAAERLGVSTRTFLRYVRAAGIPYKGNSGGGKRKVEIVD